MRQLLIFTPYFLIPFIITLIFKKYKFNDSGWTYLITLFLIISYPFLIFWIDDFLNPPPEGPRCGTPQMGFFIGNIILLLPIALIFQFIFNKFLLKKINNNSD